ncbi:hypothetical protein DKX38_013298 [Salix brachista]|uniref:Uncharacterized protein n=1 Tax=Salix brachista TaxID=2182728 RepID=A0A5N5LST5_9ROSI|nr:hypothetical protein DKX38_013298 [Salix brachista]
MARRAPSCDDNGDDCSRGGGEALIPCSNIYFSSSSFAEQTNRMSCKNYCSKCDMVVGDIFYGTDDYLDVKDSIHKEDVLEHYRRETIMRFPRADEEAPVPFCSSPPALGFSASPDI